MKEIRCPVCGTSNKSDAEACDFCGAPFTRPDSSIDPPHGRDEPAEEDKNGGKRTASGLLIFEPDVAGDFDPGIPDDDIGLPAMWLNEQEWFDNMEGEEAGPHDDADTSLPPQDGEGAEDGERLPEWLFQALETEGQAKRSHKAPESNGSEGTPHTSQDESLDASQAGENASFAEVLAGTGEKEGLPTWLENMSVDEEQLARAAGQEPAGEAAAAGGHVSAEQDDMRPDDDMPADSYDVDETSSADGEAKRMPAWLAGLAGRAMSALRGDKKGREMPEMRAAEDEAVEEVHPLPPEGEFAVDRYESADEVVQGAEIQQQSPADVDMPAEEDGDIEESGPLAGLRGVLSGDEVVTQYSTPPAYSMKLRASEKQKKDVMLLKQMLAREARPLPAAPVARPGSLRLGRMVTGILLMLVILFPIVAGIEQVPVPGLYPVESVTFHHYIENLPEDRPVLLVMEYEPALAGEMKPAVQLVLQHLMERKARLALVSTVPAGPVIGHDLLLQSQRAYPTYNLNSRYLNLGYLPGEESGVKSFALQPKTATRFGFDISHNGAFAWQHSAVKNVYSLEDFALVIVMSGDLESGRAWVEQARPLLQDTPLLVVASAQAAPLLLPYYASDQIQGLISGLSGAAAYEQLSGLPGMATQYWAAYQYGIFALILLVLLGIPLQLFVMPNLNSEKKKRA